jgi:hypothetical protein
MDTRNSGPEVLRAALDALLRDGGVSEPGTRRHLGLVAPVRHLRSVP